MTGAWFQDPLAALFDGEDEDEDEDEEEERGEDGHNASHGSGIEELAEKAASEKKGTVTKGKKAALDYEALSRHGYSGGPSILHVPAPRNQPGEQDWSWSSGKRKTEVGESEEESFENRERLRQMTNDAAVAAAAEAVAEHNLTKKQKKDAAAEQKALSFSQKEKRKRDMGQASRGKNYVEEEKRLLRDQGVYSGFDT